jgi:cytidine deaminase
LQKAEKNAIIISNSVRAIIALFDRKNSMDRELLLAEARKIALKAYSPYSRFRVGAAVVVKTTEGPRVVTGVNVENASLGLTICAERTALATACMLYGEGANDAEQTYRGPVITHVAVSCIDAAPDAPAPFRTPCGACRQWLAELAPNLRLDDLLPLAFRLDI